MSKDYIESRLAKLKALADKGVGGEALNAKKLLEKTAKRYGIDLTQISSEQKQFSFKSSGWRLQLFLQVCAHICGLDGFAARKGNTKNECLITCAENDWLDIMATFKILEKDYIKQLDLFYEAFVLKNNLGVKREGPMQDDNEDFGKSMKV